MMSRMATGFDCQLKVEITSLAMAHKVITSYSVQMGTALANVQIMLSAVWLRNKKTPESLLGHSGWYLKRLS